MLILKLLATLVLSATGTFLLLYNFGEEISSFFQASSTAQYAGSNHQAADRTQELETAETFERLGAKEGLQLEQITVTESTPVNNTLINNTAANSTPIKNPAVNNPAAKSAATQSNLSRIQSSLGLTIAENKMAHIPSDNGKDNQQDVLLEKVDDLNTSQIIAVEQAEEKLVEPALEELHRIDSLSHLTENLESAEINNILQADIEPQAELVIQSVPDDESSAQSNINLRHRILPIQGIEPGVAKSMDRIIIKSIGFTGDVFHYEYGVNDSFMQTTLVEALENKKIQLPKSLSVRELHGIAIELSNVLRKKGLVFNSVNLRAQQVADGHITLNVYYGILSEIKVYDNRVYSEEQILEPFAALMGNPLYGPSVKGAMLRLRKFAGFETFSYYSRGESPGEVRLNIRVTEEKGKNHFIDIDNYGAEETGVTRVSYIHSSNNLLGANGQTNLVLSSSTNAGSVIGLAQYRRPYFEAEGDITFQTASSRYEVGGEFDDLGLSGHVFSSSLSYSPWSSVNDYHWLEYLDVVNKISLSMNYSTLETELEELSVFEERTSYFKAAVEPKYRYLFGNEDWKGRSGMNFSFGQLTINEERSVDDSFFLAEGLVLLRYMAQKKPILNRLGLVNFNWDTRFQYTPHILPSAETFTMTGLYGVSGYESGLFSPHSGLYSVLNWEGKSHRFDRFDWLKLLYKMSFYVDLSYGVDNLLAETLSNSQADAGFIGGCNKLVFQLYNNVIVSSQFSVPFYKYGYTGSNSSGRCRWAAGV